MEQLTEKCAVNIVEILPLKATLYLKELLELATLSSDLLV